MSKAKSIGIVALVGGVIATAIGWYRSDKRFELEKKKLIKKLDKLSQEYDEILDNLENMKQYQKYQDGALRQFEKNCSTTYLDEIYEKAYNETYH